MATKKRGNASDPATVGHLGEPVNRSGFPLPLGEGGSQRAGAPGEGCKSRQILNPHLYLRLRPIGLALRALSQRERVIHQNFNFALKRICLESVSSVAVF